MFSELGQEQQLSDHIQNSKWTRMPKAGSSKPRRLGKRVDVPTKETKNMYEISLITDTILINALGKVRIHRPENQVVP